MRVFIIILLLFLKQNLYSNDSIKKIELYYDIYTNENICNNVCIEDANELDSVKLSFSFGSSFARNRLYVIQGVVQFSNVKDKILFIDTLLTTADLNVDYYLKPNEFHDKLYLTIKVLNNKEIQNHFTIVFSKCLESFTLNKIRNIEKIEIKKSKLNKYLNFENGGSITYIKIIDKNKKILFQNSYLMNDCIEIDIMKFQSGTYWVYYSSSTIKKRFILELYNPD